MPVSLDVTATSVRAFLFENLLVSIHWAFGVVSFPPPPRAQEGEGADTDSPSGAYVRRETHRPR